MSNDISSSGMPTAVNEECVVVAADATATNTGSYPINHQLNVQEQVPEVLNQTAKSDVNSGIIPTTEKLESQPDNSLNQNDQNLKNNPEVNCQNCLPDGDNIEIKTTSDHNDSTTKDIESKVVSSPKPEETDQEKIVIVKSDEESTKEIVAPTLPKESKQSIKKEQNCQDSEECETVDAQELTEQILVMLNDGKSENLSSTQELLKKNVELQEFIVKLIKALKDKINICANLDRQNTALISQAQSLKDVIAITKDLLGIRNMEVEHLHADMASMENRIKEERQRHNTAVSRLNEAMTLNDKLKAEYLIQMDLFQKLRDKYNEKVVVLTRENQRLLQIVKNSGLSESVPAEEGPESKNVAEPEIVDKNVEISEEIVDK